LIEKGSVGTAVDVQSGFSFRERFSVAFASASAYGIKRTCPASRIHMKGFFDKSLGLRGLKKLIDGKVFNVSHATAVDAVKVAGIYVPVSFHHELASTNSGHAAGFGRLTHEHLNQIVKIANADILIFRCRFVVQIEKLYKEFFVKLGSQRIRILSLDLLQRIQTGYELQISKAVLFEKVKDLLDMLCNRLIHYRQYVILRPVFVQNFDASHNTVKATRLASVFSI
jgi:hypothetical protein